MHRLKLDRHGLVLIVVFYFLIDNICKSNGSVVGMQVSMSYTKIKDRKTTRVTIHKCSTNALVSLPALMKHHWRDIVLIRDITHVCYASNRS